MSIAELTSLPDEARVWIFGTDRPLDDREAALVADRMRRFLAEWTAHSRDLAAGFALRHGRFLVVAVDEGRAAASGCSIDALTRHIRELEAALDVRLLDGGRIWYRERGGDIRSVDRAGFRQAARRGEVAGDTVVFDLTVGRLGNVREGRWELPVSRSWHGRLLPDPVAPPEATTREATTR